ncbi:MAG: FHA domain-containing protein [Christensenellaceae bacterium]|jgi:hypothetical protein
MNSAMFEAASFAMRYWFIFVVVGILIAMIYISYKEIREKRQVLSEMGRYSGYLEIVGGPKAYIGDRFGIADENTIGSARNMDISIPEKGILKKHALLYKQGEEIVLQPMEKAQTKINDRRAVSAHALKTGDIITFGNVDMRVYIKRKRLQYDD